jgi:hypothetical protein
VGWQQAYLYGGVTSLVSAGELHMPGLPLEDPAPKVFKYLSGLAKRCADNFNLSQKGPRLYAGTLLLTPGLTEADFDEIAPQRLPRSTASRRAACRDQEPKPPASGEKSRLECLSVASVTPEVAVVGKSDCGNALLPTARVLSQILLRGRLRVSCHPSVG